MNSLPTPRIAIVGAGAIGCRIAGHLHEAGVACTLVDGWPAHVEAIRRDGLAFERHGQTPRLPLQAFSLDAPPAGSFDLVFIATRGDQTEAVLPLAVSLLAPQGCIVSCQNGLNEDEIAQAVGTARTMGCSMIFGARLAGPGHLQVIEGPDQLRVGGLEGVPSWQVDRLARLLAPCGTVTRTDNLIGYRWMKLILNATGNPLLLLTGLGGQGLHDDEQARRVMIGLVREILRVALATGARPEPLLNLETAQWLASDEASEREQHAQLQAHGRTLGARRLSMVADFEARGRTEVEAITGKVVRKAAAVGLAAPLNQAVLQRVHEIEDGRRQAGLAVLPELAALL